GSGYQRAAAQTAGQTAGVSADFSWSWLLPQRRLEIRMSRAGFCMSGVGRAMLSSIRCSTQFRQILLVPYSCSGGWRGLAPGAVAPTEWPAAAAPGGAGGPPRPRRERARAWG